MKNGENWTHVSRASVKISRLMAHSRSRIILLMHSWPMHRPMIHDPASHRSRALVINCDRCIDPNVICGQVLSTQVRPTLVTSIRWEGVTDARPNLNPQTCVSRPRRKLLDPASVTIPWPMSMIDGRKSWPTHDLASIRNASVRAINRLVLRLPIFNPCTYHGRVYSTNHSTQARVCYDLQLR